MDDLIWRVLQGHASETERHLLAEWRAADPANEEHFQSMLALSEASVPPLIPTLRPSASEIIALAKARRFRVQTRTWTRAAIAAAAAVTLVLGVRQFRPADARLAVVPTEIVTGANELSTVTLGDGSVVRLAPSSRLRLLRGPNAREVWLDGRAYFAVTRDTTRRFKIHTEAGDATVLGTRFDLRANQGQLSLLVVEGEVQLEGARGPVPVTSHRLAHVSLNQTPTVAKVDDDYIYRALQWTGNFIAFESTPLSEAAEELSRRYNMQISITDSALADETVTGWFADEQPENVLLVLCRAVHAQCTVQGNSVIIEP